MYGYFSLLGIQPEEWELDLIKKLDSIALEEFQRQQEKEKPRKK